MRHLNLKKFVNIPILGLLFCLTSIAYADNVTICTTSYTATPYMTCQDEACTLNCSNTATLWLHTNKTTVPVNSYVSLCIPGLFGTTWGGSFQAIKSANWDINGDDKGLGGHINGSCNY